MGKNGKEKPRKPEKPQGRKEGLGGQKERQGESRWPGRQLRLGPVHRPSRPHHLASRRPLKDAGRPRSIQIRDQGR